MIEKLEQIVEKQVEAIQNLKIDKITVWDSAAAATVTQIVDTPTSWRAWSASLPPLQEIAKMAGVELPEYLGRMTETKVNGGTEVLPRKTT